MFACKTYCKHYSARKSGSIAALFLCKKGGAAVRDMYDKKDRQLSELYDSQEILDLIVYQYGYVPSEQEVQDEDEEEQQV